MDGVVMRVNEKYFLGGWNPDHPSENVQYRLYDNEDGTGTYITYDVDGSVLSEEYVDNLDLPDPEPETINVIEMILESMSPEQLAALVAALGENNG